MWPIVLYCYVLKINNNCVNYADPYNETVPAYAFGDGRVLMCNELFNISSLQYVILQTIKYSFK